MNNINVNLSASAEFGPHQRVIEIKSEVGDGYIGLRIEDGVLIVAPYGFDGSVRVEAMAEVLDEGTMFRVGTVLSRREQHAVKLADLAAELGIEQSPAQPYAPADVLRDFDATIPKGANSVSPEHAVIIRDAWERASEAEKKEAEDLALTRSMFRHQYGEDYQARMRRDLGL